MLVGVGVRSVMVGRLERRGGARLSHNGVPLDFRSTLRDLNRLLGLSLARSSLVNDLSLSLGSTLYSLMGGDSGTRGVAFNNNNNNVILSGLGG